MKITKEQFIKIINNVDWDKVKTITFDADESETESRVFNIWPNANFREPLRCSKMHRNSEAEMWKTIDSEDYDNVETYIEKEVK